jgi:acyl carrier protein
MNQDLLSQIQRYLTKSFFVPLKAIEPDLSFRKLALSAAEFMEIVFVLETQNHITLPDLDLLQVKTVGDLVLLTEQSLTTMSVKA